MPVESAPDHRGAELWVATGCTHGAGHRKREDKSAHPRGSEDESRQAKRTDILYRRLLTH